MRHQSLAHLCLSGTIAWDARITNSSSNVEVDHVQVNWEQDFTLDSASSAPKIEDVAFQTEDSTRVRNYRDSGDDIRISLLKIHPVVVAGGHTELHFEIDANGCMPILLTRSTESPWACAYEFTMDADPKLILQLHFEPPVISNQPESVGCLRIMSGAEGSQSPKKHELGSLLFQAGELTLQISEQDEEIPDNGSDFFVLTDDDDEGEGDDEVAVDESQSHINEIWVSCTIGARKDLRLTESWDYEHLLSVAELSLIRAKDGGIPEIEDAKSYLQNAARACPLSHPDHFRVMALLARTHFAAFRRAGTIAYLKESVAHYSKATHLCPKTHPLRSSVLIGYSEVLLKSFKDWGQRRDLDKVFDLLAEALPLCLLGSEDQAQCLHNLGVAHAVLFTQNGHVSDLEKSASYHKSVLEIRTSSHPDRPLCLYSLAETYAKLFEQSGDLAKLDTAVQYCHEALSLSPPQRPDDSLFLTQLGSACLQRYTARGDVEDLDRSIKFQREALELQREGLVHRFAALGNLGRALSTRFELRRDIADADESVKCLQQALMFYPRGHPERPLVFSDRGRALLNRYALRGDMEDLTNSIRDFGEALTLCGEGHPWHGQFLYNLAHALLIRFDKTRIPRDQKSAQRYLESGRLILHQDDPTMGLILFASAREHLLRAADQPTIWPNLVDEAFLLYEKASTHPTLGARQQLTAALSWVAAAEERKHRSSLAAYKQTFILLDKQLNVVSDVLTRHLIRKQLPTNLATNAAACAIDEGENDVATELLEQGRGLLWMQLTRLRTPIEDLRKLGPEEAALADRFEQLSKALEAGATTISDATSSESAEASRERNAQRYREMSERWEETLAEIRRVPGFTHFLQATPYSNLQDAASAGPVIVFNIGQRRSDALIISEVGAPNVIPLPQATPRTLASLSSDLANTLRTTRAVEDEKYRTSQVTRVLRQLWDIVISPVVQYLSANVKPGSRIWLCPTAELCSLPIHAAGQYRKGGSNLPDLFVCSYTPTLSALIRARQNHSGPREVRPAVLTIGERNEEARGGEATLVSASSELEGVGKLVPANIPHHELLDSAATPEGVLRSLQDHTWVHIACHGVQEPSQPFYSHFLLHRKPLRLLDIIQANLDHVKFAFTSACHTAVGDKNTPDEVIHLAAALQFAGFRSVVGTTWGMDDRDGPEVTTTFYKFMFDAARNMDHTEAAIALSAATKAMKKKGVPVDRRVVFIHIGA